MSPVFPFALEPFRSISESNTAPPSPALSIAELTPGDFPSPVSQINTAYVWDLCIIPSVPARCSIFAAQWRDETSHPFKTPAARINDESISPRTLSNGQKAICSSPVPPPLPPRPIPRRPKRSPLLTSKFSWGSTPTISPSINSPFSFRFTGPIYTFESVAEEVRSQAGSVSLTPSHSDRISIGSEENSLEFENRPWWENIAPVSAPPSPTLSVHSFSGFSATFASPTTSAFDSPCLSPTFTPFTFLESRDVRNIFWTSANPESAAEYASIFGISVDQDPFAWIRYPIAGPHDLCTYSDDEEDSDDESAHYDWDARAARNPTAGDIFDPFVEVDDVLALYCDDEDDPDGFSFEEYSDDGSDLSFDADEYSGVTENAGVADTAEVQRARFIESFAGEWKASVVKEVCVEDVRVGSIDAILSGIF